MKKKCTNCGGEFEETLPKCPFCDHINEVGAEKEYTEKLEKIRRKLDVVDEIAENDYKYSVLVFIKSMLKSTLICLVLIALILVLQKAEAVKDEKKAVKEGVEALEQIEESLSMFEELDVLYEAGEYDKIYEYIYKDHVYDRFGAWEHINLMYAYNLMVSFENDCKYIESNGYSNFFVAETFEDGFILYTRQYKDIYPELSKEELEILDGLCANTKNRLLEVFDLSEDEFNEALQECLGDDNFITFSNCEEYAEKFVEGRN